VRDADRAARARNEVNQAPLPLPPPGDEPPESGVLERAWAVLSRWAVPVMMTLAYVLLALTSDTDTTGKAWMGVGLGFVMVVWFVFRALTESAALSRALRIGDTARLFALADRHLARKRRPADRVPFLVARGLAHQLRGEFAEALAAVEGIEPPPDLQALAQVVRIGALIELRQPVAPLPGRAAGRLSSALDWLAEGQIAWQAGALDTAAARCAQVIDDVRAGSAIRAIAHVYAARIADARGEPAAGARHRAAASALAAPDATWLRG
jgi:hypothetical protein